MRMLAVAIALLVSTTAFAGKPSLESLSEKDQASLAKGELVTLADTSGAVPSVIGLIEIESSKDKIWDVLLDIDLVRESNSSVDTCTQYRDETQGAVRYIGLHYVLSILWSEVSYYVVREIHAAEDYMTWALDPAKESDLVSTTGSYSMWPASSPGRVLLRYQTKTDTGRNLPQWVQSHLTTKTLKGYLEFVKEAAER